MGFILRSLCIFGFATIVSCSNGEFLSAQRVTRDCKSGEAGCKKDLELGEATDSLQETTGTTSKPDSSVATTTTTTPKVKVSVDINGSTQTATSSESGTVCTIPATNIGVSGKRMGPNWHCKLESMSIPDAVVLPSDAYEIDVKITQYGVDDWNPCTKLNGKEIACNRNEKSQCTGGGPGPRISKFDFDLGNHLKAGSNELYVESFNKHTYWSMWFTVQGTYKTNQEGCTHTLKLIKN